MGLMVIAMLVLPGGFLIGVIRGMHGGIEGGAAAAA